MRKSELEKAKEKIQSLILEMRELKNQFEKSELSSAYYKAINQELIDKREEQKVDFSNPEEAVKKVMKGLAGHSWTNVAQFNKQLSANIFKSLSETLTKQKNQLEYNSRQMEVLKRIASDIASDKVSFDPS